MSNRYAEVIILAEDERSANLLRRYVQRVLKLDTRRIRQRISPSARGDAKQWVLREYPIEVAELRRGLRHTALVVHLDADVDSVMFRDKQLGDALTNDAQRNRTATERICHAIPKRHTETWLCSLTGIDVDEERDCKRERLPPNPDQVVPRAANELFNLTRKNAPLAKLPSLAVAVPELQRLES